MKRIKPTNAGCIVFRLKDDKVSFLIVESSSGKHWVLPKGHIEKGETTEEAALRELEEEAGVTGEIIQPLTLQKHKQKGKTVVVQYYLVRRTGKVKVKEKREKRWKSEEKVLDKLSFVESKQAFQEALDIFRRLG